ncbi:membrane protein [Streptomyces sp. NRRL F-5727]|uniref:membrane protein n=1 Tax=Streptomyces sp. NRRL F-5727 TaxID=1463871 RepID=UPI0004C7D501|nr:membrane protein [Streptomyces sp. NRRL F-5727]
MTEPDSQPENEPDTDNKTRNETDNETDNPTDNPTGNETDNATGNPTGNETTAPRWRTAVAPLAVTALLLAGGAFFHAAHQLRSTPSARNQALTDTAATTRVGGDVGEGLARIFSYTPTSSDAAERSAGTVLAGRAARQYGDLFAQVRESLVEQRLTLATQAVRTGVIELDGDSARLLVFLDQVSRRDKGAVTAAAAQLTVTARFQDDRWRITDIKAR